MDLDWLSDESHVLLNPRMPAAERSRLEALAVRLPGHVWLATSGSTGALKLTGLSKQALLASAAAVNRRLQSNASDVWLRVLPPFHVGGLSIDARAFLSGARVVGEWTDEVTLASLVPAQVFDLVEARRQRPPALRAVVVGGGALSSSLYRAGIELGWPLLPSYGMTETSSQVATAVPGSPELVLLDHVEARVEKNGCLAFRGPSLLTGYAGESGLVDPKVEGWFVTEDVGAVDGRILRVEGRSRDFIKIGGESVALGRLDAIVEAIAGPHAAIAAVPDARLGHVIHLFVDETVQPAVLCAAYDEQVLPFERARRVHVVPEIPRSGLGKLMRGELLALLG